MDDLESYFWVALWSVFFNEGIEPLLSARERILREELAGSKKGSSSASFRFLGRDASDIAKRFLPVLKAWWTKLDDKNLEWFNEVVSGAPPGEEEGYYLPRFHRFALQGVVDILEVMTEYWNGESSWEGWTEPVQMTGACGEICSGFGD